MLRLFADPHYDFVGKRRWLYAISLTVMLAGLLHLAYRGGLRYGIDFAGGTLVQVRFERPVTVEAVRRALDRVRLGESVIQQFGDAQEYLIRIEAAAGGLDDVSVRVRSGLEAGKLPGFEVRRREFVGPQVGRDLQLRALQAVLLGLAGILVYVSIRFDFRGGVAAILSLGHDVLVVLGALSLTNRQMSLPLLAALLTIVGYSINDTIVTFDRIRENLARRRPGSRESLAALVNASINQTLSRTVLTSFTVFLVVVVLYLFGGEVLRDFAFTLLVGVVTGTYSSILAASVVVDWDAWSRARQRATAKAGAGP
jgi:preprotein translocase SecF subunit